MHPRRPLVRCYPQGPARLCRWGSRMCASTASRPFLLAALLFVVAPGLSQAQENPSEAPTPTPSLDIQRFNPVGSYHNFVLVHDGQLLPKRTFGFDVSFNYAYRPLQTVAGDMRRTGGAVDGLFAGQFRAGFAITDWVEVDAGIAFMQIASTGEGILELGGKQQVYSLGDLWIEGRFRVLREENKFLSVAVIPFVTMPTGNPNLFLTSGVPTLGVKAAVSRTMRRVHAAAHFGYRFKPGYAAIGDNIAADDEILWGIGVGASPVPGKFDLNVELSGAGIVGPGLELVGAYDGRAMTHSPAELLVSARLRFPKGFDAVFGGGPGISRGVGTPVFRVFAGLSYGPIRDKDGDGVLEPEDKCPDRPEDRDGFEDLDGCPDPDNDFDGVPDVDDFCPEDPEDADGFADENGCPDHDNDEDGLLDPEDSCPDEAEDMDGHLDDDGCPEPDNDEDGVLDALDKCPLQAEDLDSWRDADGCPELDNDSDGIEDDADLCPNDPENHNGKHDDDGCPDDVLAVISGDRIQLLGDIRFATGGSSPARRSYPTINAVRRLMESHPEISKVRVTVAAEQVSGRRDGRTLADKRAKAVIKQMVRGGLSSDRLASGGASAAPPATKAGESRPSLVEFTIIARSVEVSNEGVAPADD